MTTTRIDHTGHNHPRTTAARTACRKAMKVETVAIATVGRGAATHLAVMVDDRLIGVRCGAGLQRGRRAASSYALVTNMNTLSDVTCGRCLNH